MSIRPRTIVPFVVVAFAFVGLTACGSAGPASVAKVKDNPSTGTTAASEPPCAAHASVPALGTTYHVVQVVSDDYGVKPTFQVDGTASDCAGNGDYPITFHAIPQVDPAWALCGLVNGRWHVFLADELQVPADSHLARIVIGQ